MVEKGIQKLSMKRKGKERKKIITKNDKKNVNQTWKGINQQKHRTKSLAKIVPRPIMSPMTIGMFSW